MDLIQFYNLTNIMLKILNMVEHIKLYSERKESPN